MKTCQAKETTDSPKKKASSRHTDSQIHKRTDTQDIQQGGQRKSIYCNLQQEWRSGKENFDES